MAAEDRARAAAIERSLALRALLSLAVAAWIGGQFATAGTSRLSAALTYVVILVVSIAAHEVAHAVVGVAVGARVTGMRLGFGPRLSPAGSWLDLRPIIVAAHVTYVPPRGARRGQLVAIAVAGIALHLALIVVALALGTGTVWVAELLLANVLALASNAIPMVGGFTSTSGGPNDGRQLLALLRHRGTFLTPADPDLQAAARAYDNGGVPAAQTFLAGLARRDGPYVRLVLAQAVLSAGRYEDAARLALDAADPDRPWVADHLRAEALAMLMLTGDGRGPDTDLDRAATQAEHAMASIGPTAPGEQRAAVAHTLALVRLLQGRYAEAAEIAAWSAGGAASAADRAGVLAARGWAELGLGQRGRAETSLHEAMALDRTGPLVQAFARRLTATPAGP